MIVGFKNPDTGEVLRTWELNASQEKFWKALQKYVLFSGGFGCGKSLMLVLKGISLAVQYPGNLILMGRKTYVELRDTLWNEFISTCPPELLDGEPRRSEMRIQFKNGSNVIFRHLDTIAESELRSLNLGTALIDQAEDISQEVFLALIGRLRREGVDDIDRKIYLSCNPKLTWLFADFKQNPQPEYTVIEASTLENAKNLPRAYIDNLLSYPESWRRQFVEGIWDMSLMSDRTVFAREHIEYLLGLKREPLETKEGLDIFERFKPGHRYQMGIDAAEGVKGGDEASITIVDLCCLEEAASWTGRIPPDVAAEYALKFASWYSDDKTKIMLLPEMNSVGLALVNRLKQGISDRIRIYQREEFDKTTGARIEKYGWRTTSATKPLLVSRFQELLRLRNPVVHSGATLEQFKSFVHTDEAKQKGMGAEVGFHDDRVISCLLAFWEKGPVMGGKISRPRISHERMPVNLVPSLEVIGGRSVVVNNGKELLSRFKPSLSMRRWTMK